MKIKKYWVSVEDAVRNANSLEELIIRKRRFGSAGFKRGCKVKDGVLIPHRYSHSEQGSK